MNTAVLDTPAHLETQAPISIHEFLAFKLGQEEYGVDILRVQEIRSYEVPTRMANAPAHVLGVVNLRGVIVPIIDMRLHLGLSSPRYDAFTVTIVLNIGDRVIGMVVDAVSDVITLTPEQLRPVPELGGKRNDQSILALGSVGDRMLILLAIEQVMASHPSAILDKSAQPL